MGVSKMSLVIVVLLLLVCAEALGQCELQYTEQPPTSISCSPYDTLHPDQSWILQLACTAVRTDSSDFNDFSLFWYRKKTSDGMKGKLGTGINQILPKMKRTVLTGISGLNQAPFSEEMPGDYWCLAVITNSSGQYLLTESNVLTVLRPEDYTEKNSCNGVISEKDVYKCAYPAAAHKYTTSQVSDTPISVKPSSPTRDINASTPRTSASSVSEGSSTDSIILVLVGAIAALFVLLQLLIAGITVTVFLRRKTRSKALPTRAPLQDQAARKCSDTNARFLESHDGFYPQPVVYEQPSFPKLSLLPQAMAAANPPDLLHSQIINNKLYETWKEHLQTPQEDSFENSTHPIQHDAIIEPEMSSASAMPSSKDQTYSHLQHVQASCDVSNGRHESQYNKLVHHKKELCNHGSQKQGLSSQSYGQESNSCIIDNQQYAVPCLSGPSD